MKRHEVLGRQLSASLADTVTWLQEDDVVMHLSRPARNPQQFVRELDLSRNLMAGVMEHLGFGTLAFTKQSLNQGVDRAIEYFYGDWWKEFDEDAIHLDKTRPDRRLIWSGPLLKSLLLCALTERWEEAARLSEWVDETVRLEFRFELNDYGAQLFMLCVASQLRSEHFSNLTEIQTGIREARPRRPKHLLALWEAAIGGDQVKFGQNLARSVKHRLSDRDLTRPISNILYWVAIEESLIWHIAERNGLTFPDVPPEVEASIVRRSTIASLNDDRNMQ